MSPKSFCLVQREIALQAAKQPLEKDADVLSPELARGQEILQRKTCKHRFHGKPRHFYEIHFLLQSFGITAFQTSLPHILICSKSFVSQHSSNIKKPRMSQFYRETKNDKNSQAVSRPHQPSRNASALTQPLALLKGLLHCPTG